MVSNDPGVFPLPALNMPHPPTARRPSRRLLLRHHRRVAVTALANKCITSINTLSTSFSRSPCLFLPTSTSRTRIRLLSHIYHSSLRFASRLVTPVRDSNHAVPPDQWKIAFGYSNPSPSPLPIVADRVSLPVVAGTARLLDLLPPHLSQQYSNPTSLLRPTPTRSRVRPSALCASRPEYVALIQRLLALGMVCLRSQVVVVNGVFAVAKDDDRLRLIIDARPANSFFIDPPPIALPTPDLFAHIIPNPSRPFFVAKVDIDNFYHRLLLPEWMQPYLALPPLSPSELQLPGTELVYPCCTTLPMGWSHSVFVAQHAHMHTVYSRTSLSPLDRISATADLRLTRTLHTFYVDDTIFIGHDEEDVRSRQEEYKAALQHDLPFKPSKTIAPSADGVECLGLLIDGSRHTVGVSAPKLQLLIHHTNSLLSHRHCTGDQMAQIVGRWVWAILIRRPALAVFSAVYRFIECAGRRVFTIWPSVARELSIVIGLAPLLYASLDSSWFSHVVCSDASTSGLGVVVARSSPDRIYDIATHIPPLQQLQPRLQQQPPPQQQQQQQQQQQEEEEEQQQQHNPQHYHDLLQGLRWSTVVSSRWRFPEREHINPLELRALSTALRWVLSHPHSISTRLLLLSDSSVSVAAVSKGRSSSHQILRRLRYISSLVLASGLLLLPRWIPSTVNPADGPSRPTGW